MPVFGILLVFSRESGRTFTEPLRAYMQALGYVEGRNIVFDIRYADGKVDRLPLVAQRAAVIATFGDATGLAVKAATTTIPIVSMSEDLARAKLVTNMRQPGGNITGVSIMGTELDAKRLEILAEILPARSTVLLLADPIRGQTLGKSRHTRAPAGACRALATSFRPVRARPGVRRLVTVTSPPIMRASLRERARPSPVPP